MAWPTAFPRGVVVALAVLLLGGCATFSPDGGFDAVTGAAAQRGLQQQPVWIRSDEQRNEVRASVTKLLGEPLTADTAVQVALLNNAALQATYADLGIAEADVVQAGRLRNPGFSFARLRRGEELEIERTFLFDVLGLITMPLRSELERRRFELTKARVAAEVLEVAADTRRAWHRSVAARESAKYAGQVKEAAEAGAELARRMAAAGNFSKLDHAREQVFYAEATAQLARAQQSALSERELQVFLKLAQGKTASQVAGELSLSPKTISTYRARLLSKLDARSNSDLTTTSRPGSRKGTASIQTA